jgi:hypothetical protein
MSKITVRTGHSITVYPKDATEVGALSGWVMECTCGDIQTTPLSSSAALILGDKHVSFWASQERGR